MARRGWSTSNFLRCGSAVVTAVPLSISVWGASSVTTGVQLMACIVNSGTTTAFQMFVFSGAIATGVDDGASSSLALSSTSISANTVFHALGVWTSASSRAAYLNGGGKGTDATSLTPAGLNRTSIGVSDKVSPDPSSPFAPSGTGDLAEVAVWNVALSDADAASLALGVHPFMVRPDKLVAYWDLLGYNSPENNRKSNSATMAIQGSLSQSAHPRIFMPNRGLVNRLRATPPALAGQILM